MRRAFRVCVAVLPLLLAGCDGDFTVLGPTPAGEGIIIFIHVDFAGSSQAINVDVRDLQKTEGPCSDGGEGETPSWHKCVSSVRVFPGLAVPPPSNHTETRQLARKQTTRTPRSSARDHCTVTVPTIPGWIEQ
jgi:hypothetical protein